jgi:hypothetical protein
VHCLPLFPCLLPQHARRYEQLTSGSEVVESQLKAVLPELLNAEIVLRTIGDVSQVCRSTSSAGWMLGCLGY